MAAEYYNCLKTIALPVFALFVQELAKVQVKYFILSAFLTLAEIFPFKIQSNKKYLDKDSGSSSRPRLLTLSKLKAFADS